MLLLQIFYACNNPDETANRPVQTDTLSVAEPFSIKEYSSDFQKMVQTSEGVFRGVNLGLNKESVKRKEAGFSNSELQEEGLDHLDYMISLGSLENTDLTYRLNDRGNVSSIEVNIYPNSKVSQDSIFREFEDYFTKLYGTGVVINPDYKKWEQKKSDLRIEMQKKGTQKIHDINITFSYLTRESAGVLYEPLPEGL